MSLLLITYYQGVHRHQLNFALDTLLSKATIPAAQKIIGSSSSNKNALSLKGSCHRCLMSCTRFLHTCRCAKLKPPTFKDWHRCGTVFLTIVTFKLPTVADS